ncbi:hypothetical protein [Catenovulum sediminis]|uniref:YbgF trimerisation domain-containing protein n=1 Tax=Catenovulum sediminis TaxID=1740262 RepID=A0ABV1RC01_9ALTE
MSSKSRIEQMEAEANEMIVRLNSGNTEEKSTTQESESNTDTSTAKQKSENLSETPVTEQTSQPDTWEQKYRILQGKYNSEMNRLNDEIKSLKSQSVDNAELQNLKRDIQALKNENQTLRQQVDSGSQSVRQESQNLDDSLMSEFGDDVAKAIENRAQKIAAQEVAKLKSELGSQVESVNQKFGEYQQQSNAARLEAELAKSGVNFEQVDSDPLFVDWLQELAPYSSMTKHQLLVDSYNRGDIQTAAQFYVDYSRQIKPAQQKNPLEQSVSHHSSVETSDSYSQGNLPPEQVGRMIEENERRYQRKQISQTEYEKRNRELFTLLHN